MISRVAGVVKLFEHIKQCRICNLKLSKLKWKSFEGNSTKLHLAVGRGGLLIFFDLLEGQRHGILYVESLGERTFLLS